MRIRGVNRPERGQESELAMTAMIDIVFLLLIFFIMTFRITAPEGDFDVKMPGRAPGTAVNTNVPIAVRLVSDEHGALAAVRFGDRTLQSIGELHEQIRLTVGDCPTPQQRKQTEVQLDCDRRLHYKHTMAAVSAISGYIDRGRIVRLVEKISFVPPRASGGR